MDPLILPSIKTTLASPSKDKHSASSPRNGRRSQANSRSTSPTRLGASGRGSNPSSPSTSSRSPARQSSQIQIPPLDKEKCERLANLSEEDMSMQALGELEVLRKELQASAIEASQHLTALLEQKEVLTGQNETYNTMIQVCLSFFSFGNPDIYTNGTHSSTGPRLASAKDQIVVIKRNFTETFITAVKF